MPLYEYWCSKCHYKFEMSRTVDWRYAVSCPKCGGEVRLVPSAFSFKFKEVT